MSGPNRIEGSGDAPARGSSRDASSARGSSRDASSPVSDAIRSLDTRLDDVRRETSWRAIEGSIDERPAQIPAPTRTWRWPVFALATLAVVIALVFAPRPTRDEAQGTASNSADGSNGADSSNGANGSKIASSVGDPPTTLSASAGQRTVFDRDGLTITLVGPGVATVRQEATLVRLSVTKGLVVADRTPSAPVLAVDAGDNHVVSRDARFAVRVEPTMVVLGAGEQARQIVERHAIDMGASPLDPTTSASAERSNTTSTPTTSTPTNSASTTETSASAGSTVSTSETSTSAKSNDGATTSAKSNVSTADTMTSAKSNTSAVGTSSARSSASRAVAEAPAERTPPTLPDLRLDATELYKRAEAALAVRDPAGAREFLERLLSEYPADPRIDAARYDLALIARSFGQRHRALELLDALIATGTDENLKAAARRLRPSLAN